MTGRRLREEVATNKAAVAAYIGIHAGADFAIENVTGGPIFMNQTIGLIAQVVFVLRPQQDLVPVINVVRRIIGRIIFRSNTYCQIDIGAGQVDVVTARVAMPSDREYPAAQRSPEASPQTLQL